MGVYIQLINSKDKFEPKSQMIRFHSDEDEAEKFVIDYVEKLKKWTNKEGRLCMPLARLELTSVMMDLIHKLGIFYLKSSGEYIKKERRIQSWMRLYDSNYEDLDEELIQIDIAK